jgi:uncharacterized repeat protein (TIGR01451 family)
VRSNSNLTYTITVFNVGPDPAANVVVTDATPVGTIFVSSSASQGTCTNPPVGGTGTITCTLGTIAAGGSATVTVVVHVTAPAGTTLSNTATATTSSTDPNTVNNAATKSTGVITAIVPPTITSVTFLHDPFRVKIVGSNFQPGVVVFIGASNTPWPNVRYKDSTTLVLKKGAELKALFPKGVPVQIKVVNLDGGFATTTAAR